MKNKPKYRVFKVLDSESMDMGLVRHIQNHITLDAPEKALFEVDGRIGLDYGSGDPIYLKVESWTWKQHEDRFCPVLIRDHYIEEKTKKPWWKIWTG